MIRVTNMGMFSPVGPIINQASLLDLQNQFKFKTAILEDTPQVGVPQNLLKEEVIEDSACIRLR